MTPKTKWLHDRMIAKYWCDKMRVLLAKPALEHRRSRLHPAEPKQLTLVLSEPLARDAGCWPWEEASPLATNTPPHIDNSRPM